MNLRKRAIGGIMVAGTLVVMCTIADAAPAERTTQATVANEALTVSDLAANGTAGVVVRLNQVESGAMNYLEASAISIERSANDVVAAADDKENTSEQLLAENGQEAEAPEKSNEDPAEKESGEQVKEMSEETTEEPEKEEAEEQGKEASEEAAEEENTSEGEAEEDESSDETAEDAVWQNRLMADVDEYLNIRASGDENAEITGKLYKGDVAEIVERGDTWTHIRSGNADGYVKNEYCVFGMDALAYARATFDAEAELTTDALRIRSEASTEASVLTTVYAGTVLKVDADAETVDGWVAVDYKGQTGYASAEYVTIELALGEAITIEEEQAELARLAEEEAARKSSQVTEVTTVQNEAVSASTDELTLLAAIIQCEAGSECYEGQVAVGAVVMNRVRSGSYPGTIYDVVYQPGQFSPAGSGSLATVVANGPSATCIQAAQDALNGTDNTGGAVSFRRASSGHAGVVIGNHVFF